VNATHTGSPSGDTLKPALARRWSVDLTGTLSYPLIADGNVYVTAYGVDSKGDSALYALDQGSGRTVWGPVVLPASTAYAAYDGGRVFVHQQDNVLRAFDSRTGAQAWMTTLPGQPFSGGLPTAVNGTVYALGSGSGLIVYAVSESSGQILWSAHENGGGGSPTVTGTDLFLADDCNVYDLSPSSGAQIWNIARGCSTGNSRTTVYNRGLVYVRDSWHGNVILDGRTGSQVGTFGAGPAPAFDGNLGFFLNGGRLEAHDLSTGAVTWAVTGGDLLGVQAGDGALVSAPTAANGYVYVATSNGYLFALTEATGQTVWSDRVGVGFQFPEQTALAIGQGGLAAPLGSTLVFYTSAPTSTPSPLPPPSGGLDQSQSYQLNPQHTGGQDADPLRFPLAKLWSATGGGPNSYPLIAGGRIYFADGGLLFAQNAPDGSPAWGPLTLSQSSLIAYDNGSIFAIGSSGSLSAFDATTGAQLWTTQLPQASFQSYPTASNGAVYIAGGGPTGGTLFAVSEQSGALLWSQNVLGSGDSSPVVTSTGVYIAYPCPEVYDFDPATGALIWHVGPSTCTSQAVGPRSAVLYNGLLYVRDTSSGLVLDATTGAQLGVFRSTEPPAFSGSMVFYTQFSSVEGWDLTTGSMVWRWDADANQVSNGPRYYGVPSTPPVVVNGYVLFGFGANVYALDGRTGRQVWTGAPGTTNSIIAVSAGQGFVAVAAGPVTVFSTGGLVNGPSPTAADESVSHQINVAHSGGQPADRLTPPLVQRWALDLGNPVSYPLIVAGRAYFVAKTPSASGTASQLDAVDLSTGASVWGPLMLDGPVPAAQAALGADNGRLFVQQSGILHAYDAQNGTELWSRLASLGVADGLSPVAANGMLFAGPMRFDEETGAQIWRTNEVDSKLDVVTGANVYVDIGCENTDDMAAADGKEVWIHYGTICGSGAPDIEPALYDGRLYFHDYQPNPSMPLSIVDTTNGAQLGTYWSDAPAAFSGTLAYFVKGGALEAHNLPDLSLAWTFAGDGALVTAPVVANGVVYIGSSNGNLYGVDALAGAQIWSVNVGTAMSAPDGIFAPELTGFAVGEGWLLIPAGTRLVAYSSAAAPTAGQASSGQRAHQWHGG